MDDALRAGVLDPTELPAEVLAVLGQTHSARINTLVTDLVSSSERAPQVTLSAPVADALDRLRDFMFERVYLRPDATSENEKAVQMIRNLFGYFLDHPDQMPPDHVRGPGDLPTQVADFVAGMTDRYALRTYEQLFLPQRWLP
jgi:dGTPase